jgi:hypothetical protein
MSAKRLHWLWMGTVWVCLAACSSKTSPGEGVGEVASSPPLVSIDAPMAGSLLDPGASLTVQATVVDDRTPAEDVVLVLRSSIAGELDTTTRAHTDGNYTSTVILGSGDHVLTLTAEDGDGNGSEDAVDLIVNARPSAPIVRIDPEAPVEGYQLKAEIDVRASDPEGDPIIYSYSWALMDVDASELEPYAPGTEAIIPWGITKRGQTWAVTVTPSDGYGDGEPGDAIVAIANELPTYTVVQIQPSEPKTANDLETILMGWYDSDGDPEGFEISWTVNGEEVPDETTLNLSSSYTQRDDVIGATVVPWDGYDYGEPIEAEPVIVQNTPPSLAIVDLQPYTPSTLDDLSVFVLGWVDDDGDPEQYRYRWFVNGVESTTVTGDIMTADQTNSGDGIAVEVTPYDDFEDGAPVMSETVYIDNAVPSITGVSLTPGAPDTTQDITAVVVGWSDIDGDPERYHYSWYVNGTEYTSSIDELFSATLTTKGDEIYVEVTPYDDHSEGAALRSGTVTVQNTEPSISTVEIVPAAPITTDDIQAVVSGWSDADEEPETLAYDWTINGVSHVSALSYVPSIDTVRGDEIQVTVTPSDSDGDGASITSDPVVVQNSPPTIDSIVVSPEHPISEDTITCEWFGYADLDGDSDSSTRAWSVNGTPVGTSATLSGVFTSGDEITCTVTAHDGTDAGNVLSGTVTVDNTRPRIVEVTITPDPAYADDTLTCAWSGFWDPDGHSDMSTAAWSINGSDAGSGTTLTGGFVHGDVVGCTVTPSDGLEEGDTLSTVIVVSNSLPSITSVEIVPGAAVVGDTLTCEWSGFSDADGEADESTVLWMIDGSSVGTGRTLSTGFVGGDSVTCAVTPRDGTDSGTPVTSLAVVIDNTQPLLSAVYLSPDPADVTDTMVCTAGSTTDADGTTAFTFSYEWFVAGTLVPSETFSTLSPGYFFREQTVHCVVTPHDGTDFGDSVISNVVTIQNSRPEITSLVVVPTDLYTNDTITTTVTTTDLDGDSVFVDYIWLVDGVEVLSGATASSLSGLTYFDKHESVQVVVTPHDGLEEGLIAISDPITVQNTPPESPTIEILPPAAEPEDTLECIITVDSTDADGDEVDYDFEWYVDGDETTHTGTTVPPSATAHGERWECVVTPFDGDEVGLDAVDSVVVNDLTDPDPPVIDDDINHSNDTEHTIAGDCEADCAVVVYCDDDTYTDTYTTTCSSVDRFSVDVTLTSGQVNECYATCTDLAGNTSGASDVVSIEVCSPVDPYEGDDTYGDEPSDVIDEWSPISDDGSATISIVGNVLDEDVDDWYVVAATDDLAEDLSAGSDAFNFHVEMTSGTGEFRFVIHKGGTGAGDIECTDTEGYTDYNWYNEDVGDGTHPIPSDTRSCAASGSTTNNECADDSDDFYIHVFRLGSTPTTCQNYQLDITNGL